MSRPIVSRKPCDSVDQFFGAVGLSVDRTGLNLPNPNKALDGRAASFVRGVNELISNSPDLPRIVQMMHEQLAADFVDALESDECYVFDLAMRQRILSLYHYFVRSMNPYPTGSKGRPCTNNESFLRFRG